MNAEAIALALLAATLHATWNALLRIRADRLWSVTVMSFATSAIAVPFAIVLPFPPPATWPYVAISASLQVGYSIFLTNAYRYGELGQVYPAVRGSVPLLVTLGSLLVAGERLTSLSTAGVGLVVAGLLGLGLVGRRTSAKPLLLALLTAVFIAGYTTVDALAVRRTDCPSSYVTWVFLVYGLLMPLTYLALRRSLVLNLRSRDTQWALLGGAISLVSYGAVVSAFSLAPAGPITALRETSVLLALLIGRFFLGEALSSPRIIACAVVAAGVICLVYQP